MKKAFAGFLTKRLLKWHAAGFCAAVCAIAVFDLSDRLGTWVVPITILWGFAVIGQYMAVKTVHADETWAAARASELQYKSYDFGHIKQIEASNTGGGAEDSNGAPERKDGL